MAKKQKKQKDKGKKKGKARARVTRPSMYTKQIVSRRKPSFRDKQSSMINVAGNAAYGFPEFYGALTNSAMNAFQNQRYGLETQIRDLRAEANVIAQAGGNVDDMLQQIQAYQNQLQDLGGVVRGLDGRLDQQAREQAAMGARLRQQDGYLNQQARTVNRQSAARGARQPPPPPTGGARSSVRIGGYTNMSPSNRPIPVVVSSSPRPIAFARSPSGAGRRPRQAQGGRYDPRALQFESPQTDYDRTAARILEGPYASQQRSPTYAGYVAARSPSQP